MTESRPPALEWSPLLTTIPEPKKIAQKNPILHTTRGKRPTREMIGTIKILAELTKEDSLNLRTIASSIDLDRATTRKYLKTLAGLRFVRVENVTRTNQVIPMYSITLMGKIQLLASDFDYTGIFMAGKMLEKTIHSIASDFPEPKDRPLQRFTKRLLTELLRTDPISEQSFSAAIRWIRHTAKSLLNEDLNAVWDSTWFTTISKLDRNEAQWYFIAINDALIDSDKDESFAVVQRLSFLNFLNRGRIIKILGEFNLPELAANIVIFDTMIAGYFKRAMKEAAKGQGF